MTGYFAVSGEDAGTLGPKILEQVVREFPGAIDFSKANPKKFGSNCRAKDEAPRHDFVISLPQRGKSEKGPTGFAFDKFGVRLLDWVEANGYQLVTTACDDACGSRSIFRKV